MGTFQPNIAMIMILTQIACSRKKLMAWIVHDWQPQESELEEGIVQGIVSYEI